MKLTVYKGFNASFLADQTIAPLVVGPIEVKKNVLQFDTSYKKRLGIALLRLGEKDEAWISYEEYSIFKPSIDNAIAEYGLRLEFLRNNLYPDYYPITFELSESLIHEITRVINGESNTDMSAGCQKFTDVYNTLVTIEGVHYGSFYNYEYSQEANIQIIDYYPQEITIGEAHQGCDYDIFLNEDVETYLRDLARIKKNKPEKIGLKSTEGEASKRLQASLQAYCVFQEIQLFKFHELLPQAKEMEEEFKAIARDELGITGFTDFRMIKFYKNPDIDKEVIEISQAQIIQEIIKQAERSYNSEGPKSFRDVFITASTGSGKSLM